jgi:hypothetical protein
VKIISGGQTGVDQAALDVAIYLGMDYGGFLPRGRLTEEGPLDEMYDRMTELSVPGYPYRTRKNVAAADATLLFTRGEASGGTLLTLRMAEEATKPRLLVDLESEPADKAVWKIKRWLAEIKPGILNVAGPRESTCPGIGGEVYPIMVEVFQELPGEN